jgi:hypothetical protein
MSTLGFFLKRAVFDLLEPMAGPGQVLADVQLEYATPGKWSDLCVYLGGFTSEQPHTDDVVDGDDVAPQETVTLGLYIRSAAQGLTNREQDARAEDVGDRIGAILRRNPRMCGNNTVTLMGGGTGDYVNTDDGVIVIAQHRIVMMGYLDPH